MAIGHTVIWNYFTSFYNVMCNNTLLLIIIHYCSRIFEFMVCVTRKIERLELSRVNCILLCYTTHHRRNTDLIENRFNYLSSKTRHIRYRYYSFKIYTTYFICLWCILLSWQIIQGDYIMYKVGVLVMDLPCKYILLLQP
jgi:hypothetical protein